VYTETGAAAAGLVAAGSSAHVFGGNVKSGTAAAGLTARGARAVSRGRSGTGIAGLTVAGARRVVYVESGVAILEGTGSGVRQVGYGRAGHATAGLYGSGHEFLPGRQPLPPGLIAPPIVGRIDAALVARIAGPRAGPPAAPGRGTIAVGEGGGI
jgi:hypothetical protein